MSTVLSAIADNATALQAPVKRALRTAAKATGVGFDYLVNTAVRESSLNPQARARSSSASGLFQFIDSTWLATLKEHGPAHGFVREAAAIRETQQGYVVDDPAMRRHIMDLRFNPEASARMGAAFAQDNRSQLESALGRQPSAGELYIAHFMGAQGARKFILNALHRPAELAADAFPQAAAANPSIFYEKGAKRSNSEVYAALVAHHQSGPLEAQQLSSIGRREFSFTHVQSGPLFRNMFASQRMNGVSKTVSALWSQPAVQPARAGFFPMSRAAEPAPVTPTPANGSAAL